MTELVFLLTSLLACTNFIVAAPASQKMNLMKEMNCEMNLGPSVSRELCLKIMNQEVVVESNEYLKSLSDVELEELLNGRQKRATTCPSVSDITLWVNSGNTDNISTERSMAPYLKTAHCDRNRLPRCLYTAHRLCDDNPGCINFAPGPNQYQFNVLLSSSPVEVRVSILKWQSRRWRVKEETITIGYTCLRPSQ